MPQENNPQMTIQQTSLEPEFFVAVPDGKVFENRQKLPVEALITLDAFKGYEKLLRFAFDPRSNSIYLQDAKDWHGPIASGEDEEWDILNVALRFLRQKHGVQPKMRYGEAPGTFQIRKTSQFTQAWDKITDYCRKEFNSPSKDIPVIEYVPNNKTTEMVEFRREGGAAGAVEVTGPAFFVNLAMNDFGQLDYDKVNDVIAAKYLANIGEIHPVEWNAHLKGTDHLYFAIWSGETKIFKANHEQRTRLIDEDSLRMEPSLKGYDGPILLFSFDSKSKVLTMHNAYRNSIEKSNFMKQLLGDIMRKLAKSKSISESSIILAQDDMSNKPFVTKMSRQGFLWDFIRDVLAPEAQMQPYDLSIVEAPLTKDGEMKAKLVITPEDERSIPAAVALRAKHKIDVQYPYIAVDSRIKSKGIKFHELLKEYAELLHALKMLPLIHHNFSDESEAFDDFVTQSKGEEGKEKQAMLYMLEIGMDRKSVLDFFSPRENVTQRAHHLKILDEVFHEYKQEKAKRRVTASVKTASLDLGINDWYFYTLQDDLNQAQHTNDKAPVDPTKPLNSTEKKKQITTTKHTTEGLLNKKHDHELSYMKTTEQLLRESRI